MGCNRPATGDPLFAGLEACIQSQRVEDCFSGVATPSAWDAPVSQTVRFWDPLWVPSAFPVQIYENERLADVAKTNASVTPPQIAFSYSVIFLRLDSSAPLTAFLILHELAHAFYRHQRTLAVNDPEHDARLRAMELQADCWAARFDLPGRDQMINAALEFFERQGNASNDSVHPTGTQRIQNIRRCRCGTGI